MWRRRRQSYTHTASLGLRRKRHRTSIGYRTGTLLQNFCQYQLWNCNSCHQRFSRDFLIFPRYIFRTWEASTPECFRGQSLKPTTYSYHLPAMGRPWLTHSNSCCIYYIVREERIIEYDLKGDHFLVFFLKSAHLHIPLNSCGIIELLWGINYIKTSLLYMPFLLLVAYIPRKSAERDHEVIVGGKAKNEGFRREQVD